MKYFLFYNLFLLLSLQASAQQNDSISCPAIKLEGPWANRVAEGSPAIIRVKSFKKDFLKTHTLSYSWSITDGLISEGRNKNSVTIDTKGLVNKHITAAVVVEGLGAGCPQVASITIDIEPNRPIITEQKIRLGGSRN